MSFEYQMVKCSHCGTSNAFELETCRRCGRELKKSNTANVILLALGGAFFMIALLSLLIYLTRDTEIGGYIVLAIAGLSSILSAVGYLWLVYAAFQVSGMWGVVCLFIPLAHLAFLFRHADRAIYPFSLSFFSTILLLITVFALPGN